MKSFAHEDPAFDDLLRVAAHAHGQSLAIVEKDYWVTHTLWALQASGLTIWFISQSPPARPPESDETVRSS